MRPWHGFIPLNHMKKSEFEAMIRPIIIIDDDADDLFLMKDAVNAIGCPNPVITFDKAEEALDYLKQATISPLLIMCDTRMPRMDGVAFRSEMLKIKASPARIPFFLLSGATHELTAPIIKKLKVSACITKANSYEGIKKILRQVIAFRPMKHLASLAF